MLKEHIKIFITIFIVAIMLVSLIGCNGTNDMMDQQENNSPSDNVQNEQMLTITLEGGDWGLPSPFAHYPRGPGGFKMRKIFDSLLEKDENGHIPWLAESWSIEDDGKTYVFRMRDGIKWHDGTPMTIEDVKFSFDYFSKHPAVWDELTIDGEAFIEEIEIIDSHTIKFSVDKPNATHLEHIGITRIIPKHIWEKVEDPKKYKKHDATVGCGPYILKEYNKEHGAYKLEAFKEYWGPKPLVDAIEYIPVSDPILAFEKKEIDVIDVSPDLLSRYQNSKDFAIKQNPAFWGYKLVMNMNQKSELKDEHIRQALAYAIDQNELIEKVARGAAVPASAGYLPVDHVWYNENVKNYEYDTDKAKTLLQGKSLTFELLVGNSKNEVRIAELLKISMERAGITLQVKSVDMKTRDAAVKNENYELALIGHGGWGADADSLREAYALQQAGNESPTSTPIPGYANDEINTLAQQQMTEMDVVQREKLVYTLQKIIAEELPMIPLYNTTGYIVYRLDKYNGWTYMFDHHSVVHSKLSFLERE